MKRTRFPLLLIVSISLAGCVSLNYPAEPVSESASTTASVRDTALLPESPPPSPVREAIGRKSVESDLGWSDLTRLAREHQRRGEYDKAEQRLEQAALLVADLPPTHSRRRAVYGTRARFAESLASRDEVARADALADELIEEARAEPELGGPALVSLALSVAKRRTAAAISSDGDGDSAGKAPSQLPLLEVALSAARTGSPNRERYALARNVAQQAYHARKLALSRSAIDLAVSDFTILASTQSLEYARLLLQRARIAVSQGAFESAAFDATPANQLLEQVNAPTNLRGYGEATLAEALAGMGESKRALQIARGALARLSPSVGAETVDDPATPAPAIDNHTQRVILGALARVEATMDETESAIDHYDEALAIPEEDSDRDRGLIEDLLVERTALAATGSADDPLRDD